jgi:putative DNA methylase
MMNMKRPKAVAEQQAFPGIELDRPTKLPLRQESGVGSAPLRKSNGCAIPDFSNPARAKTCLEVDFPILPINELSKLEGNAGKPIYQMSKWWARRRSSVFRAMLIAAAMEAPVRKNPNGSTVHDVDGVPIADETEAAKAVWDAYYTNHQKAGRFSHLKVLDCFMGGGTTLVEGSRLGFQVAGADLNPVAWFVVKNELACTEPDEVRKFFEEIELEVKPVVQPFYAAECPRGHIGRWFRESQADPSSQNEHLQADFDPLVVAPEERKQLSYEGPEAIYTFWAKHGSCSRPGCDHRTPIFRSPVIAEKKLGVKYIDLTCKNCKCEFHAELGAARMAPLAERVVLETEPPFTELSQPFAQRLKDYSKGSAPEMLRRAQELSDVERNRSSTIESYFSSITNLAQSPPGSLLLSAADRKELVINVIPDMLRRDLTHKGLLSESITLDRRLLFWIELV